MFVADHAPGLMWVSGPDKRSTWFNRAWLEFTGRSLSQEIGDGWIEGVHPDDRDSCLRKLRLELETVAIANVVQGAVGVLQPAAERRGAVG